jgi:hypothetical protein
LTGEAPPISCLQWGVHSLQFARKSYLNTRFGRKSSQGGAPLIAGLQVRAPPGYQTCKEELPGIRFARKNFLDIRLALNTCLDTKPCKEELRQIPNLARKSFDGYQTSQGRASTDTKPRKEELQRISDLKRKSFDRYQTSQGRASTDIRPHKEEL